MEASVETNLSVSFILNCTEYAYHDSKDDYEARLPGIIVMPINFNNALPLLGNLTGACLTRKIVAVAVTELPYVP